MKKIFFNNIDQMYQEAAIMILKQAEISIAKNRRFNFLLSGGKTPEGLFAYLAKNKEMKRIWEYTHFYWGDERSLPPNDNLSNYKLAFDFLISKIDISFSQIHRIEAELLPEKAAEKYNNLLKSIYKTQKSLFDVNLMGVGTDGHTASIFPQSFAINERERLVVNVPAPTHIKPHVPRITLTFPALLSSESIIVLASGNDKKNILKKIENENSISKYPIIAVKEKSTFLISE